MSAYNILQLVAIDGRQDRLLMATELSNARLNSKIWDLDLDDILKLETLPLEKNRIIISLENHARLPKVLCNIIIEYAGSAYADALLTLGKSTQFNKLVTECKSRERSSLRSAQLIISMLANSINMPVPKRYFPARVRDTISNINKFDSYPKNAGDLKRCAVFHQLLLTYF